MYKTIDYWSRAMLNFNFLESSLGIVPPPYFVYGLLTKVFLMFTWSNLIVCLFLFLEILANMCIAIVSFSGCDVIYFKIRLIFLIEPFSYMTKKSRQKFYCLEKEKRFSGEIKSIFIIFIGLPDVKNCCAPLIYSNIDILQHPYLRQVKTLFYLFLFHRLLSLKYVFTYAVRNQISHRKYIVELKEA